MGRKQTRTWQRFVVRQALRGLDAIENGLNPLKKKLSLDSHYRFRSVDEVKLGVKLGVRIDANRATVDDWLRLPGISIHQARTLVELSRSGVPLTCWEDVAAATGLGLGYLQSLGEIVQFYFYDPDSEVTPRQLNVNRASAQELATVPGLGHPLAERLVGDRTRYGPYRDSVDLKHRLGLPPRLLADLLYYLRF